MKRWGNLSETHFDRKELKTDLGEGNFIFVGSSCDMFAFPGIKDSWIVEALEYCRGFNNSYLFQSKNPASMKTYLSRLPSKTVLCTTLETNRWIPSIMGKSPTPSDRAQWMGELEIFDRYVTIEPIIDFDLKPFVELIKQCEPKQVNIGADSGKNGLPEPSVMKVSALIEELSKFTTIARKNNLGRLLA